jgi:uncharacterized membrane protein
VADEEAGIGSRASDRLITFTDAVVAIAITLLALDLPVPTGRTVAGLWASVMSDSGQYLAFLISFIAIAGGWSQHHELFRYARSTDGRMKSLHLAWLLTIIILPFATKLLFDRETIDQGVRALHWGFYALVQFLESAALFAMVRRMVSHDMLVPGTPPLVVAGVTGQSLGLMLGFGLSIPLFFATSYAWALWIAAPLLSREVRRRLRARDHDHDHDHDRGHDADGDGDRHRHRHRDHPEET